jgi:hypothetical protein
MSDTYQLKHPITQRRQPRGGEVREEIIEIVTLRRLKAKDLRALDRIDGKFAQSLAVIAALSGLSTQIVDELDAEDVEGIGGLIGDFFPTRPPTGEGFSEA